MNKIPLNLTWRAGITPQPNTNPMGDPGTEMARAFVRGLDAMGKPPRVEMPQPTMSKQDKYMRDLLNGLSSMPTFGEEDTTPETQGELQAMYNPQFIIDSVPVGSVQGIDRHNYVSYGMILE